MTHLPSVSAGANREKEGIGKPIQLQYRRRKSFRNTILELQRMYPHTVEIGPMDAIEAPGDDGLDPRQEQRLGDPFRDQKSLVTRI